MIEIKLNNLRDTEKFGEKLGLALAGGDFLSLTGGLGSGKTTLTKSIGLGLGVEDYITSPTFALINEYEGRVDVFHFDVYRLESEEELLDLGYEDYFYSNGVTIVEWANKIEELLPKNRINVNIEKGKNLEERVIKLSGEGNRYREIVKELDIN